MIIRHETKTDYRATEEMTREAFWNLYFPGCDEHFLVHVMRNHPDYLPELSFVAEVEGKIAGAIMYTKSAVLDASGKRNETVTFGPLCVHPSFQNKGIGKALIEHSKKAALEAGYPAVIILGFPKNYCKRGFKNTKDFGISDIEGRFPYGQMALELYPGALEGIKGKLVLSEVFNFDRKEAEKFDKTFPPKEKKFEYSHAEFDMACRAYL